MSVQVEAQFCGQCGHNLAPAPSAQKTSETSQEPDLPVPLPPNPQLTADDSLTYVLPSPSFSERPETHKQLERDSEPSMAPQAIENLSAEQSESPFTTHSPFTTQVQLQSARLVHLQSNTFIELPEHL
ncbi:MAG: hypothetical protein AAF329_18925, partial [Cyanobacteria bacterium P01_A01_bin.17]